MASEINYTDEHYRSVRLGTVRLTCILAASLFFLFMIEDWFLSRPLFAQLVLVKVFSIPTFVALFFATFKQPFRAHSECLAFLSLFTIQLAAFFHSRILSEEVLLAFVCLICATFSASIIPWRRPWHLAVIVVSFILIVINSMFIDGLGIWPLERVYFLSIVFLIISVPLHSYSSQQVDKLSQIYQRLYESERETSELAGKLASQATTDYLTGSANRRGFFQQAARYIDEYESGPRLVVAFIDLDHFKSINDRYGHTVGDGVLEQVVSLCQVYLESHANGKTHLSRIGGEEFALLISGCSMEDAYQMVDTLRLKISETKLKVPIGSELIEVCVTASAGLGQMEAGETEVKPTMVRCDKALYMAKNAGRNNVKVG